MSHTIVVDAARCAGDGLCTRVCPESIFVAGPGQVPRVVNEALCNLCGQCLAVCPQAAIEHGALSREKFRRIQVRHPVEPGSLAALIQQRRSVRAYTDQPVSRDLLASIIRRAAAYAPIGAQGGEGWRRRVVVVLGREAMADVLAFTAEYARRLLKLLDSALVRTMARWKEAPRAGRLVLPDLRYRLDAHARGRDVFTYGAPAAVFVHAPRVSPTPQTDCDLVLYAVILLAEAYGLGTCWSGYLAKAASGYKVGYEPLRAMLEIPAHHDVYAAAVLGHPAVKLHSVPQREVEINWVTR